MTATPPPPRCAVGPDGAPEYLAEAVTAGGGVIVDADDAEVLVWYHSGPEALEEFLRRAPKVRWVQLPAAGIEDYRELLDSGRIWTCAKGVYADPVAEHALALALAGMRGLSRYTRRVEWSGPDGINLFDARVAILGGGGIAQALVRLLAPFRAATTVIRRHPDPIEGVERVVGLEALHDVLPHHDLVVLALALTPETAGIMGMAELDRMAESAWLVNVARGGHVVTEALVQALQERRIGGAGLDVTDPEPLPAGHPLWELDNCIISPHVGNTPDMHAPLLAAFTRDNVGRFARGEPLRGLVRTELGY